MIRPITLALSLFLSTSLAYDNGQYNPSEYGGYDSVAATSATAEETPFGEATGTMTYPIAASITVSAQAIATAEATGQGWQYSVTWPAGCESWANPCPAGAHISGGGIAGESGYTNGFTSYTTMTNSDGVITGMPAKATVAAGVSGGASTLVTSIKGNGASNSTASISLGSSSTLSGFSSGTSAPAQSNGAGATYGGASALLLAIAAAAALL